MALKFKGTVDALPTEGVAVYDAYYNKDTAGNPPAPGYKYCSAASGGVPTAWSAYAPIKIIDDLALSTTYEGNGAPTATSNAVQLPDKVGTGTFWLDGSNGDVYAYLTGTQTGWNKW